MFPHSRDNAENRENSDSNYSLSRAPTMPIGKLIGDAADNDDDFMHVASPRNQTPTRLTQTASFSLLGYGAGSPDQSGYDDFATDDDDDDTNTSTYKAPTPLPTSLLQQARHSSAPPLRDHSPMQRHSPGQQSMPNLASQQEEFRRRRSEQITTDKAVPSLAQLSRAATCRNNDLVARRTKTHCRKSCGCLRSPAASGPSRSSIPSAFPLA